MNRKDTILVAVVINAGLLAILFATAIISDTDKVLDQTDLHPSIVDSKPPEPNESASTLIASGPTGDEVDNVLNYYTQPSSSQPVVVETSSPEMYVEAPSIPEEEENQAQVQSENFVEVTVKKGDVLEKIAKANHSTVSAIKKANQLKSERLNIGQVLKVPVVNSKTATAQPSKKQEVAATDSTYHVVKNGDSPWKIAKQYNVKYEDILRLNGLDEEKARNLKVGDKIRVK